MKKILIPVLLLNTLILQAQNIGVNATGATPDASAILDVSSADKGLLIPRIALIGTNVAAPVTAPTTSLMVYNTATAGTGATSVTPGFYYWDGANWLRVVAGNSITGSDDQNLTGATLTGTNLQIDIENGSSATVNLAALQDGTGTDSQTLGLSGNTLSISGGNSVTLTDNVNDADNVVGNEYNTGFSVSGGNLNIVDGGGTLSIALSSLSSGSTGWGLTGNSGTASATNFVGTTDNQALSFRVNNVEKIRLETNGTMTPLNVGRSVFIGDQAGTNDDLSNNKNVFIGYRTGNSNTSGDYNTALGPDAMRDNTAGSENIAVGFRALYNNTTGDDNSSLGAYSMINTTTGIRNVAMGNYSLHDNISGRNNSILGYHAFYNGTAYENSSAIGAFTVVTASNQIRLGSSSVTSIGGNSNWTNVSDARFKTNVKENVPGLDLILKLRPVTYNLDLSAIDKYTGQTDSLTLNDSQLVSAKKKKSTEIQTGFIAQEVEAVAKKIGYDFSGVDAPKNDGDYYGLRYAEFVVPLVQSIQEQQKMIEMLKKQNSEQQNQINELSESINKLTNK